MAYALDIPRMLESLQRSLGPTRSPANRQVLRALWDKKDYPTLLGAVARHMHVDLPLAMRLCAKKGPGGAPAWVSMPVPMPIYGTQAYCKQKIIVSVHRTFLAQAPFDTLVFALAHECAHIILDGIQHLLKREERAVDLAAMMLGFAEFAADGHRYHEIIRYTEEDRSLRARVRYFLTGTISKKTVTSLGQGYKIGYLTSEEVQQAIHLVLMNRH